ncbi:hypothetical protein VT84_01535 [Gemmata sp. SH-PL17]|uniref:hypothetical protein n=1 Tax=Gemmata sp. SH-PL17 TaxID=1630693 RepID=UPI00078D95AA|nr:hypothetical protein [Gemmata sp. SH-PL17]AMV23063.1 hypothetical protein VT84_01535 [Gemmata sp. SH-PL17]
MKRFTFPVLLAAFVVLAAGCGKDDDPNKNLKPIDPNTPKPMGAGAGPAPKQGPGDGSKAPAPVSPP